MTSRTNHLLVSLFVIPLVAYSFAPIPAFPVSRSFSSAAQRTSSSLRALPPPPPGEAFIIVLGDDDDRDGEEEDEEEEDEEEDGQIKVDQYIEAAQEEFQERPSSSALATNNNNNKGDLTTKQDWGGALGKLRQRMEDIETGKSDDPSHALFRVMSAQTPNQLIGQFVTSANPQTVQAMSGAVSSLLGGMFMCASSYCTRLRRQKMHLTAFILL